MFTARHELGLYIIQLQFRPYKFNVEGYDNLLNPIGRYCSCFYNGIYFHAVTASCVFDKAIYPVSVSIFRSFVEYQNTQNSADKIKPK